MQSHLNELTLTKQITSLMKSHLNECFWSLKIKAYEMSEKEGENI